MERSKGIAYCGLACALCSDTNCVGCRNAGCPDKDWCKSFTCCRAKRLAGCWDCDEFPCQGSMLDKPRVRVFASFVREHGEGALLDCLERNESLGIRYHYPGKLVGDYDLIETEAGIIDLLTHGKKLT